MNICNKDTKGAEKSTKSWVIKLKSMEDYNSITEISEQLIQANRRQRSYI